MIDFSNPNALTTLAMLGQYAQEMMSQCITKVCRDCKSEFIIYVKEQQFYKERNLSLPVRCKQCREKRKNNRG